MYVCALRGAKPLYMFPDRHSCFRLLTSVCTFVVCWVSRAIEARISDSGRLKADHITPAQWYMLGSYSVP